MGTNCSNCNCKLHVVSHYMSDKAVCRECFAELSKPENVPPDMSYKAIALDPTVGNGLVNLMIVDVATEQVQEQILLSKQECRQISEALMKAGLVASCGGTVN